MTLEEKIGQLYMVQVFSNQSEIEKSNVINLIRDNKIGGVIYSKGGPVRQAKLNNELTSSFKSAIISWYGCGVGIKYAFRFYLRFSMEYDSWSH